MPTEPEPAKLYSMIWRWHFYAGLLVAPVLIVVATTGALLIFKDELERILYPNTLLVTPAQTRASYETQLEAAKAFAPRDAAVAGIGIDIDPLRATAVFLRAESGRGLVVYVDPHSGKVLGDDTESRFYGNVLTLHRRLFIGRPGRVVVELVTCWTIVLLLSGAYLWWPRKSRRVWGVWLPRLRAHPYVVLRDLHAVCGLYIWCVALTIAGTGLFYSTLWGSGYARAARMNGAFRFWESPQSRSPAEAANVRVDEIIASARQNLPGASITVNLPRDRNGAAVVFGSWQSAPADQQVLVVDRATGEVLQERSNRDLGVLEWWLRWNYPLHIGSVLGTPTKVIWLMACLGLITLPVTGVWMWWQRRPPKQAGFPARPTFPAPPWLFRLIVALCVLLPMFGISVVAILLCERAVRWRLRPGGQ